MAFFNNKFEIDEREENLKREISSFEFRKETIILSIDAEIANLRVEQEKRFLDAGRYAYEVWNKDKSQADLIAFWNKVKELANKIAEQETKKNKMKERYDEEIKIMASNLNSTMNISPSSTSGSIACPYCGAGISYSDVFCQACGTRLKG